MDKRVGWSRYLYRRGGKLVIGSKRSSKLRLSSSRQREVVEDYKLGENLKITESKRFGTYLSKSKLQADLVVGVLSSKIVFIQSGVKQSGLPVWSWSIVVRNRSPDTKEQRQRRIFILNHVTDMNL